MIRIVAGKHKKRLLFSPQGDQVRPTLSQVREAVFNICQLHIEGAVFLDLFAGSGAMGLEALSRGAKQAIFIEQAPQTVAILKKNIALLQEESHVELLPFDYLVALKRLEKKGTQFDLIYADPPYGKGFSEKILQFLDQTPLLKRGGWLFIEDTPFSDPLLEQLALKNSRRVGKAHLKIYGYLREETFN